MMQVVLVFVSKILMFAFCHLVISGVRWLVLVPPVILLASVSILGVQLSPESQSSEHSLQASSPLAGKVHRSLDLRSPS